MLGGLTPTRVGTTLTDEEERVDSRGLTPTRVGTTGPQWSRPASYDRRLTPTRVGTTVHSLHAHARKRVPAHPHTRGDDVRIVTGHVSPDGSPPHAWGRRTCQYMIDKCTRLTPTRVGTTRRRVDRLRCPGSPPHAWGRHRRRVRLLDVSRLTPTRVGTTCHGASTRRLQPRGSPPHAWGRLRKPLFARTTSRLHPPHAWGRRGAGMDAE